AAGVAERALGLVVPAQARGRVRLVRVDEQKRGEDGVEIRLVLDRDPVLGLDAHDFRDGYAVPRSLENRNPWPGPGEGRGGRAAPLSIAITDMVLYWRCALRSAASPWP